MIQQLCSTSHPEASQILFSRLVVGRSHGRRGGGVVFGGKMGKMAMQSAKNVALRWFQ